MGRSGWIHGGWPSWPEYRSGPCANCSVVPQAHCEARQVLELSSIHVPARPGPVLAVLARTAEEFAMIRHRLVALTITAVALGSSACVGEFADQRSSNAPAQ